jgi:hypothetical protein
MTQVRWAGASLSIRFREWPDLTLADLEETAACAVCGGSVTVTVEEDEE